MWLWKSNRRKLVRMEICCMLTLSTSTPLLYIFFYFYYSFYYSFGRCSNGEKLNKVYIETPCIMSYKWMWISNYLKIKCLTTNNLKIEFMFKAIVLFLCRFGHCNMLSSPLIPTSSSIHLYFLPFNRLNFNFNFDIYFGIWYKKQL